MSLQSSPRDLEVARTARDGWHHSWRLTVGRQYPAPLADAFVTSVRRTTGAIEADHWCQALEGGRS